VHLYEDDVADDATAREYLGFIHIIINIRNLWLLISTLVTTGYRAGSRCALRATGLTAKP